MKKRLNVWMMILTALVAVVFAVTYWKMLSQETNHAPVLSFDTDQLHVSVDATEQELLQGVTAMDPEDGDVTDSIVIEGISEFVEDYTRIITYAAFDSAGNVQRASREVTYTDYRSPSIKAIEELEFLVGEDVNLQECIYAEDVLDGNITGKIRVIKSNYSSYMAGEYTITLQVTNSCGDTVEKDFKLTCIDPLALLEDETDGETEEETQEEEQLDEESGEEDVHGE